MEAPECVSSATTTAAGIRREGSPEKMTGKELFIVDELLDFSNDDEAEAEALVGFTDDAEGGSSSDSSTVTAANTGGEHFSGDLAIEGFDLCEPYEYLAELEWLSNLGEEPFSGEDMEKLQLISGMKPKLISSSSSSSETQTTAGDQGLFRPEPGPVPGKARSKRSRAAACNWPSRLLLLSSSSSSSPCKSEILLPAKKPPTKKKREPSLVAVSPASAAAGDGRKCLHCATERTPQWRTGPLGPKTLCNACGVRYKSGRLVPEYRPAASPTFVASKHSNSHRKVMELRRQKDIRQFSHLGFVPDGAAAAMGGEEVLIEQRVRPEFEQLV